MEYTVYCHSSSGGGWGAKCRERDLKNLGYPHRAAVRATYRTLLSCPSWRATRGGLQLGARVARGHALSGKEMIGTFITSEGERLNNL